MDITKRFYTLRNGALYGSFEGDTIHVLTPVIMVSDYLTRGIVQKSQFTRQAWESMNYGPKDHVYVISCEFEYYETLKTWVACVTKNYADAVLYRSKLEQWKAQALLIEEDLQSDSNPDWTTLINSVAALDYRAASYLETAQSLTWTITDAKMVAEG